MREIKFRGATLDYDPMTMPKWMTGFYHQELYGGRMRVYQNEGLGTPSIFKLPENRMNWRDPIFGWISGIFDSQGV